MFSHSLTKSATVLLLAVCMAAMMISCASKPSNFYVLRSVSDSDNTWPEKGDFRGPSLLVGPISLPDYLDRNQMVSIKGENELVVDEFNRWGESLEDNFYRVLTENLSLLMQTPEIYAFNKHGGGSFDFQIIINVTRFESSVEGNTRLTAFWEVADKTRGSTVVRQKSELLAAESATNTAGRVKAQNELLNQLSSEIAKVVMFYHQ